jgi:hypothetical protein
VVEAADCKPALTRFESELVVQVLHARPLAQAGVVHQLEDGVIGSTADFESVCEGSNPSPPTKFYTRVAQRKSSRF